MSKRLHVAGVLSLWVCFYYVVISLFHNPYAAWASLLMSVNLSVIDEVSMFISSIQYRYRNTRWILLRTEQIALIVGAAAFVIFLGFTLFIYNFFQFFIIASKSRRYYSKVSHKHLKPMYVSSFSGVSKKRIKWKERWHLWYTYVYNPKFILPTNEYGSSAEDKVVWSLVQWHHCGDKTIFRNRRIPVVVDTLKGKTSEIDVIWWHHGTLYSIEVKNWAGILEYKNEKEWSRTLSDRSNVKSIRSPSAFHVQKTHNLRTFLEQNGLYVPVVPLVLFVNDRCTIDNRILEDSVSMNWDGWLSFLESLPVGKGGEVPDSLHTLLLDCRGWDTIVLRGGERLKGDIFGIKMYDTIIGRRFIPNKSYLTVHWRKGMASTFLDFVVMGWPLGYVKTHAFSKIPIDPYGSIRFQPVGSKSYIDIKLWDVLECTAA